MEKPLCKSVLCNTSSLEGAALDWAVAKCEDAVMADTMAETGCIFEGYKFSTDWSQGGLIIEREGVYLRAIRKTGHPMDGSWLAQPTDTNTGTIVQWVERTDWPRHYWSGSTPLIAAMRCYVASKLGEQVEIPTELLNV